MRTTWRLLALAALLAVLGCAAPERRSGAVPPAPGELATMPELDPGMPVSVGIEGRGDAPRVVLVPDFKESPLTPEERAALGEREDRIRRLDYTLPDDLPSPRVGRWLGGVQAAAHGATLLVSRTDRVSGIARAYHALGGAWSAEGGGVAAVTGTERSGGVRTGVHGTGGASTGEIGPSRIAGPNPRLDK